jgi:hypothetical protein
LALLHLLQNRKHSSTTRTSHLITTTITQAAAARQQQQESMALLGSSSILDLLKDASSGGNLDVNGIEAGLKEYHTSKKTEKKRRSSALLQILTRCGDRMNPLQQAAPHHGAASHSKLQPPHFHTVFKHKL